MYLGGYISNAEQGDAALRNRPMTPQHRARSRREDSGEDLPPGPGANRGQVPEDEREDEIIGLKRKSEALIKELDLIRPESGVNQVVIGSDLPLEKTGPKQNPSIAEPVAWRLVESPKSSSSRKGGQRLPQPGSNGSLANNQTQNNGCTALLLILSFLIACGFPPFWLVFVLLLVVVLASSRG